VIGASDVFEQFFVIQPVAAPNLFLLVLQQQRAAAADQFVVVFVVGDRAPTGALQ